MYTETNTKYKYVYVHKHIQAQTNTYKAAKIKDIWWSDIYRVMNNRQRPKSLINWVSRPAVTSLALPVN